MANIAVSPTTMERVDAGFEWAEENIPDWRQYVDPKKLDMMQPDLCFLGQYQQGKYGIGSFYDFLQKNFDGNWDRTDELGFSTMNGGYPELNAAWRQKFEEMNRSGEEAQG